jgi:hypothetical protein
MPAAKHREIYLGTARTPEEIGAVLDGKRTAQRPRFILPRAPAGQSVVGIDPGKRGGLVYLAPGGTVDGARTMPLRLDGAPDTEQIEAWLRWKAPARIFLELVHAHPNDGKRHLWTFAAHMGALKDAIARTKIPCHEVDPQRWQNAMLLGLPRGARTKESARARCAELWPSETFKAARGRMPHDGLCDAALIAAWGLYFSGVRLQGEMPRGAEDLL